MKRLLLTSLLVIMLVIPASANLCQLSDTLKTPANIQKYVRTQIRYEYHYYAIGAEATLMLKKGDCTDTAMLMQELLKCQKISSRLQHGYATYSNGMRVKHDWLTVNGKILDMESPIKYELIGGGIW